MSEDLNESKTIDELVHRLVKIRARCQPVIAIVGSGMSASQIPLMEEIIEYAVKVFNSKKYRNDPVFDRQPELRKLDGLRKLFAKYSTSEVRTRIF